MRSSLNLRLLLPALLLSAATSFAQATAAPAVQSRISTIGSSTRIAVPHSVLPRARAGADLGAAPASRQLTSLMLVFNRSDAQEAVLTQLLIDLQNPSSPRYHQWLTPEQFGAQFGLSSSDLAKVSAWITSQGFAITETGRGSNYIRFSGSVAQVQQAFGTTLHNISIDGETHIANLTDPVLPAAIANVVTGISGLNDIKLKSRARTRVVTLAPPDTTGLHPQFTSSVSGAHFIAPGDFYTIYDVTPLLNSSINGTGVGAGVGGGYSIAVAGQTDISVSDVAAFRTASGLTANAPAIYCAKTSPGAVVTTPASAPTCVGTFANDLGEAQLDVEWAGAVAPSAKIVYVVSSDVFTSLFTAINNNLAPILSISYGACEDSFGPTYLAQYDAFFKQANAQGQTVVGPSGDSGATDCDYADYPAVDGLTIDYPASSAYVTSAGGSMFNEGSGTYWNTNSSSSVNNAGSALSYIPETVWNESSATNGLAAGGGGASLYFSKPYWQVDTLRSPSSVPNDLARDVPDIALNAASVHDGSLYCVSGSCVNGTFRASDGQSLSVVGGTSVAAPSFAGILALVEQKIGSRIGNAGPVLYALANSTSASTIYHDITTGNNNSACVTGTFNCPNGGSIGYSAAPGYDLATGWGSVDAANLAIKWTTVTPIAAATGLGQNISYTSVTTASPTCGAANTTLALSIKVTQGSGTTVPTGTVQILVDGVASGSPIPLVNGAATTNFSTTGLASGSRIITAAYSGDTLFAGSKSYVTADVVSSTQPDFLFTPCSGSISAVRGASSQGLALSVAPVNGFTGTITFTATTDTALNASYAFTPATVTISSTASATTNLVLSAYTSSAVTSTGLTRLKTAQQQKPRVPWSTAGSGIALASMLLLVLPRRRRWSALLVAVLSIAALGATGCGSGASFNPNSGTGTGTGSGTITNATPGTYYLQVIATSTSTSGTITSHTSYVTFVVQ